MPNFRLLSISFREERDVVNPNVAGEISLQTFATGAMVKINSPTSSIWVELDNSQGLDYHKVTRSVAKVDS